MSILGNFRVSATPGSISNSLTHSLRSFSSPSKVDFASFLRASEIVPKCPNIAFDSHDLRRPFKKSFDLTGRVQVSRCSIIQEAESLLPDITNMGFFERLNLALKIIFPSHKARASSNARIAKQRLKMILYSDRCAVSDKAKQMIVSKIIGVLSDFVVIESQDKVQLSVSSDSDIGTIYSVTVPVRRVKREYQDVDGGGTITNIEYKDDGESSGSVDVRFDFYVPD